MLALIMDALMTCRQVISYHYGCPYDMSTGHIISCKKRSYSTMRRGLELMAGKWWDCKPMASWHQGRRKRKAVAGSQHFSTISVVK